ncbi:hypothetical protein BAE44_0001300 [Dichanthelium oligosanthes]|uniref:No apical meristem-associated C-terminal domain-containing protein n=1 Tax=Dichanthelium oligosanthes TaxID=888268 RepID=A0A1E5WJU2_9POAL|nr:hypothetical protein BAE44_0001300 [Dichanthelium oligosanthes]
MSMDRSAYEEWQEVASREEAKQMASQSERKLKALERNVQIQESLLQLREEEEENKVMILDVEKMPPWVRDYYIKKQKKTVATSRSGEGSSGRSAS